MVIQKKIAFFPSNYLKTFLCFVLGAILIVSYSYRFGLFCSARSVMESSQTVTPYCIITGEKYLRVDILITIGVSLQGNYNSGHVCKALNPSHT